jgi:hypothetical protein
MIRWASQIMPIQKVVARIAVVAAHIQGLRRIDFGPGLSGAFALGCISRFLALGALLVRRIP